MNEQYIYFPSQHLNDTHIYITGILSLYSIVVDIPLLYSVTQYDIDKKWWVVLSWLF